MTLLELQTMIHERNKAVGWWDEERPFSTFVCLFHSELSKAMEGGRKGLMDDHLPQYPMFQVELADFVIRCMDWLGSKNANEYGKIKYPEGYTRRISTCSFLANLHKAVSKCLVAVQDEPDPDAELMLSATIEFCFNYANNNNFNLHQIILEKVEYNKHRADHKRENRQGEVGQKRY